MSSYEEILAAMREKFTELAGYSPDDASDVGIRMKVLAGELFSLCTAVDWLKMQAFPQTARGNELDLHAQERGAARKPAQAAQGVLRFGRAEPLWYGAEIPAGTVCSTAGEAPARYVTTQAAILPQGELSTEVPARAEEGGKAGNALPGTVTVLVTPPAAIDTVTNPAAFAGGADAESDSELRSRLMQSYAGISDGTNTAFYREQALKFDGVYSAGVVPRENGPGTVGVYLGGRGTVPPAETVALVREGLRRKKEINVDVNVAAAQTVPVEVAVSVAPADGVSDEEAVRACTQAVADYFAALSVGESVFTAAMGATLFATEKIKNYFFHAAVTQDRAVAVNQLAVCGTVTVLPYTEGAS